MKIHPLVLVTVLYKSAKHLPVFFHSLQAQSDQNYLVVAIDNASPDNSSQVAEELSASLMVPCVLLSMKENLGVAEANNIGIRYAAEHGFEHLVIANNDVYLPPDVVRHINQEVISAGCKAWTPKALLGDTEIIWYGGGYLSKWRARGIHRTLKASDRQERKTIPVSYAPTCFMYVHMDVFRRTGYMDPLYFVYYDDTDFCLRMQRAAIELIYDPRIVIKHYAGGSSGGDTSFFFLHMSTRNKLYYIWKHYHGLTYVSVLLLALLGKAAQLLSPVRRSGTWKGLIEGWKMVRAQRHGTRSCY